MPASDPSQSQPQEDDNILIYLDQILNAVFSHGRFHDLFNTYRTHVAQWEGLPKEPYLDMMLEHLAAATLYTSCRPRDEHVAITTNLLAPPVNFFTTSDNTASTVTGRLYLKDVRTSDNSRMYVESRRPLRNERQSTVELTGLEVLAFFEQYYRKSDQTSARLFRLAPEEFLLVQGIPGIDPAWMDGLTIKTAQGYLAQGLPQIEHRCFRFHCGCELGQILNILRGMFRNKAYELFGDDEQIQTSCPRCGRAWWISREEFLLDNRQTGLS